MVRVPCRAISVPQNDVAVPHVDDSAVYVENHPVDVRGEIGAAGAVRGRIDPPVGTDLYVRVGVVAGDDPGVIEGEIEGHASSAPPRHSPNSTPALVMTKVRSMNSVAFVGCRK